MTIQKSSKKYNINLKDGRSYIIQATPLKGEDGGRGLHPSNGGYTEVRMLSPKGKSHPFATGIKPKYLTVKRGLGINPQHAWFVHAIIKEITEMVEGEALNKLAASIVEQGY